MNAYEFALLPYRKQFAKFLNDNILSLEAEDVVEVLQNYSQMGFEMTEHVEEWLQAAAAACSYPFVSEFLFARAAEEKGHEKLMARDAKILMAKTVFGFTSGISQYDALHWEVIKQCPVGMVSLMYEIEKLSIDHGPRILQRVNLLLGDDFARTHLSFLTSHVNFDVTHTKENQACLEQILEKHPSCFGRLVEYGVRALSAYQLFLQDCLNEATHGVAVPTTGRELHVHDAPAHKEPDSGD